MQLYDNKPSTLYAGRIVSFRYDDGRMTVLTSTCVEREVTNALAADVHKYLDSGGMCYLCNVPESPDDWYIAPGEVFESRWEERTVH